MRRLFALMIGVPLTAACAVAGPPRSSATLAAGAIPIVADAVPLNPTDPAQDSVGAFVYAGGLALTSAATPRLHGLSDLKFMSDGRFVAVSDEGDLLEARIVLDRSGRVERLTDSTLTSLPAEDGEPLMARGKEESDAEGIAIMANGDRLISLEDHDRILIYPRAGGRPRPAASPAVSFPFNLGMEALADYPSAGADAYLVGAESTGETWVCRLSATCVKDRTIDLPPMAGLVAVQPLADGDVAYLLRSFSPAIGNILTLRILDRRGATVDELVLRRPLTVDNFEGMAAVPRGNGRLRFYLLSDDNFSSGQRTLLLAFDWQRPAGR